MAACPIVHFHEPEIGIEAQLPGHPLLHIERRHGLENRREETLAAIIDKKLRCGTVEACLAVEMIDLHEDRAGLRGAALAQDGIDPLHAAAPQIGGDPEVRSKP